MHFCKKLMIVERTNVFKIFIIFMVGFEGPIEQVKVRIQAVNCGVLFTYSDPKTVGAKAIM